MTDKKSLLEQKLTDAVAGPLRALTRREIHLPAVAGKALAVIGARRAGKTTFLSQCLADRLVAGRPRESLVLIGLEDDRLTGLTTADLDWLLEEYFRRYPALRGVGPLTLALDEVQEVPQWERFVRRVLDTEQIEVLLSGSSAKLLSREVATSLRGRALEVLVHPFGFREALRHQGSEPRGGWETFDAKERSRLDAALRDYLGVGGFPEAQGVDPRDRRRLLASYVDVAVLRDVIERHAISNPLAVRWLQRQLLSTPAGSFSINKVFNSLRSQGLAVGKDTLHDYLSHLEDAFLIRTVWLHSASERQRMVNPRKVYPVDPGLIELYDRTGSGQTGHALETVVLLELERRQYEIGWVRAGSDLEVDFRSERPGEPPLLVQVCADASDPTTLEREVRALEAAAAAEPRARPLLLTLEALPPRAALPAKIVWQPAARWLLEAD